MRHHRPARPVPWSWLSTGSWAAPSFDAALLWTAQRGSPARAGAIRGVGDGKRRALVRLGAVGAAAALLAAACGDEGESPSTVTGRVVSLTDERYCISPDRGETETCVDVPAGRSVQGIDVGECVTTARNLTSPGARVEVVDERECAGGDLGDS